MWTNVFPPVIIQIFTAGQETGGLEEMLDRLAESYERQVASMSARLAAALEPILIVFLAECGVEAAGDREPTAGREPHSAVAVQ